MAQTEQAHAEAPRCESLEELFAALESPLLGYASRLLHDREMAQDTVQEAFLRLHAQFDQVREPRPWLYRTVHNLALNHLRRIIRLQPLNSGKDADAPAISEPADPGPLPDEEMARQEGVDLVRSRLGSLDVRSRELLRLKFNDELSYKEISARTGLTIGHVGYLLHHALKNLASKLARTGLVP